MIAGNSLVVQWLELCTFTAEGWGSVSGRALKIPLAVHCMGWEEGKEGKENDYRASIVVQWLGSHLTIQGTLVHALVWEDSHIPQGN